jgi:hypothetical protein
VEEDYAWAWPVLVPSLEWMLAVVLDALVSFLSLELAVLERAPSWASVCNEQDGMLCYTARNSLDTSLYSLYSNLTDEQ